MNWVIADRQFWNKSTAPPPATQKLENVTMHIHEPIINGGTARHSERAIRILSKTIKCSVFDVRCLDDNTGGCTFNERGMSIDAIARVIPKLRHRNVNGCGIFIRPCLPFALADDVSAGTIDRMLDDDQRIAAVIETSPGSYQVWIPLAGPLRTVEAILCAAACERLAELYGTDPGVAHRDSFGRAPGFRNRKPEHECDGNYALVTMSNRHSHFRGYDQTLLNEARQIVADNHQPLAQRSAGAVLPINNPASNTTEYLGPIEVLQNGNHVVQYSALSTDQLFDQWLQNMHSSGYAAPLKSDQSGPDRSQRDLDVMRSMYLSGVPCTIAQAALETGSDKAQSRGSSYIDHLMISVWGKP